MGRSSFRRYLAAVSPSIRSATTTCGSTRSPAAPVRASGGNAPRFVRNQCRSKWLRSFAYSGSSVRVASADHSTVANPAPRRAPAVPAGASSAGSPASPPGAGTGRMTRPRGRRPGRSSTARTRPRAARRFACASVPLLPAAAPPLPHPLPRRSSSFFVAVASTDVEPPVATFTRSALTLTPYVPRGPVNACILSQRPRNAVTP